MSKIVIDLAKVRRIAATGEIPVDFWQNVKSFILRNDNTSEQYWQEEPFRHFEEFI